MDKRYCMIHKWRIMHTQIRWVYILSILTCPGEPPIWVNMMPGYLYWVIHTLPDLVWTPVPVGVDFWAPFGVQTHSSECYRACWQIWFRARFRGLCLFCRPQVILQNHFGAQVELFQLVCSRVLIEGLLNKVRRVEMLSANPSSVWKRGFLTVEASCFHVFLYNCLLVRASLMKSASPLLL